MTKETQRISWTNDSIKYDGTMTFCYSVKPGVEYQIKLDKADAAHVHEYIIALCERRRAELEAQDPLPKASSVLLPRYEATSSEPIVRDADFASLDDEVPF